MTHRPLRYSQLIAFDNAAAGHPGVLSDQSGEVVVKPCSRAEISFYESCAAHPAFAYYMPTFLGTLSLAQNQSDNSSPTATLASIANISKPLPIAGGAPADWTPSNGEKISTDEAIVLENVAAGFRKPNILDVKLGARLWADDALVAKRQKLEKVAAETTSAPLGFRIAGMKIWQGENATVAGLDGYRIYDKEYGRKMKVENVKEGFGEFFFVEGAGVGARVGKRVIGRFLEDLRGLRSVLEDEESRMYSASLLFVYEGDGAKLKEDLERRDEALEAEARGHGNGFDGGGAGTVAEDIEVDHLDDEYYDDDDDDDDDDAKLTYPPKIQAVKMIDFAHAGWTPGEGRDQNVLQGIGNVIRILEELLVQ